MQYGMILNIVTCLIITAASIFSGRRIYLESKREQVDFKTLGMFWIIAGLQWFLSGLRLFFLHYRQTGI